jgi:hypothetical protein
MTPLLKKNRFPFAGSVREMGGSLNTTYISKNFVP